MRILIATETYVPDVNGAAYFAERLASHMRQRGHEVHIVCPATHDGCGGERESEPTVHELPSRAVPRYPQLRVAQLGAARRGVRRAIAEVQPDVVHVQNHFTVGRAALVEARQCAIPVIGTNHFLPTNLLVYLPVPAILDRSVERLLWWHLRLTYRAMTVATAPTPYAAELTAHACRREVECVSCGVDEFRFRPGVSPVPFRRRYGIPQAPTILSVGRLDPEKHVGDLVRALPMIREQLDARLVVVGRGQQRVALGKLATQYGVSEHVTFCDFVPDDLMPGAYAAGDVYCHAGTEELQSISTLEAMASGMPIVAADARALPLLVAEGVNGFLCPPGDVDRLASRLCAVLGNEHVRSRMGAESRKAALRHSAERSVAAFEAIYERAISSTVGRAASHRPRAIAASTRTGPIRAVGTLATSLALAVPALVTAVRPEPVREHTDLLVSYVLAAFCAVASVGMGANFGLARLASRPGWLNAITASRSAVLVFGALAATVAALVALIGRGAL